MDLANLQVFIEVMRRGNFAVVARDRDVSPSSISRAISALESELGIRLFQRSTRRIEATEAGQLYFARIEPVVDELQHARDMAIDISEQPRGRLRISAPVSFGQLAIVPFLPELTEVYPELFIELILQDSVDDLLAEHFDIALRLGPLKDSAFIASRLCDMRFVVCASPDWLETQGEPQTPAEVADCDCLVFPMSGFNSCWRFRGKKGQITEVPVQSRCSISNASALKECALADMGLVLLPHWIVWRELQVGTLRQVLPAFDVSATDFDSAAWLLYPSRRYLPLKVRVFVDFVKGKFGEGVPWEM